MGKRIEWTDQQLRSAVADASSWRQVADALGMARGSTHRVQHRAAELGLNTTHMTGNRRWDPTALRKAIAAASTWDEVAVLLGAGSVSIGRIRGAARRCGIDARHIDRAEVADSHVTPAADLARLPVAAEALAAGWLMLAGLRVSIPTAPSPHDLLVSGPDGHHRVQVKSTTHRDQQGRWVVVVAHRPYRRERSGGREPYNHDEIDDFFIVNADGECYLIPIASIAGRISILLDHYPEYRIGSFGQLFGRR